MSATPDNLPPLDPGAITGWSARQMREAPKGATYIIHNMRARGYFMALARAIGRDDLVFMSLASLGVRAVRGVYVLDHEAERQSTQYHRELLSVLNT